MTTATRQRMLLSHNFNLSPERLPALSRSEFCQIFQTGLGPDYRSQPQDHPHWILEIVFDRSIDPAILGQAIATALQAARGPSAAPILVLGGRKTTPAAKSVPGALRSGEWGVDVIETTDPDAFLASIKWSEMITTHPADSYFAIRP